MRIHRNKKRYNIVRRILTQKQANSAAEIQNRITDLKMLQKEYNEVAGEEFSLDECLKLMVINSCPTMLEREVEVRGLDEKSKTFNEVVEEMQRWARKSASDRSSPGVNAITEEEKKDEEENQSDPDKGTYAIGKGKAGKGGEKGEVEEEVKVEK